MSTMQMSQEDHPSYNIPDPTEKYAGDVVFHPGMTDVSTVMKAAVGQSANQRAMDNIAKNGPKSVDTTNLKLLRPGQ